MWGDWWARDNILYFNHIGSEELVLKVGNLITSYSRAHLTVWGSFKSSVNYTCWKHFGKKIPLFMPISKALLSFSLYSICLHGLWDKYCCGSRYSCIIFPNVKAFMWPGWFKCLNRLGLPVILFGVPKGINSFEEYEMAAKYGANGICTDRPSLLMRWLAENPLRDCTGIFDEDGGKLK